MRTITICTDAGHKNIYKQSLAVWACYIRTPTQIIRSSGFLKEGAEGSSQAELYALANALHIVGKEHDLSKFRVIVYSDNQHALRNHQDGTLGNAREKHMKVYNRYIRPYIKEAKIYEPRHVKAHLPQSEWSTSSARHFMQDWCDQEVHRLMKVGAKVIYQKQSAIDLEKNRKKKLAKS